MRRCEIIPASSRVGSCSIANFPCSGRDSSIISSTPHFPLMAILHLLSFPTVKAEFVSQFLQNLLVCTPQSRALARKGVHAKRNIKIRRPAEKRENNRLEFDRSIIVISGGYRPFYFRNAAEPMSPPAPRRNAGTAPDRCGGNLPDLAVGIWTTAASRPWRFHKAEGTSHDLNLLLAQNPPRRKIN